MAKTYKGYQIRRLWTSCKGNFKFEVLWASEKPSNKKCINNEIMENHDKIRSSKKEIIRSQKEIIRSQKKKINSR